MKRYLISCLLMIFILNAELALAASIDVYPSSITKAVGSTFTVDIKINNVTNLAGFDVKLSWNSNILELVSVTAKPNNLWINNIKMQEGKFTSYYSAAYVQQVPSPSFSGSASIATLTFKVKSSGSCILELTDTMLGNADLEYIDHSKGKCVYTTPSGGGGCGRGCYMVAIGPYLLNIDPEPILSVTSAVLVVIEIVIFLTIYNRLKHTKRKKR